MYESIQIRLRRVDRMPQNLIDSPCYLAPTVPILLDEMHEEVLRSPDFHVLIVKEHLELTLSVLV